MANIRASFKYLPGLIVSAILTGYFQAKNYECLTTSLIKGPTFTSNNCLEDVANEPGCYK